MPNNENSTVLNNIQEIIKQLKKDDKENELGKEKKLK